MNFSLLPFGRRGQKPGPQRRCKPEQQVLQRAGVPRPGPGKAGGLGLWPEVCCPVARVFAPSFRCRPQREGIRRIFDLARRVPGAPPRSAPGWPPRRRLFPPAAGWAFPPPRRPRIPFRGSGAFFIPSFSRGFSHGPPHHSFLFDCCYYSTSFPRCKRGASLPFYAGGRMGFPRQRKAGPGAFAPGPAPPPPVLPGTAGGSGRYPPGGLFRLSRRRRGGPPRHGRPAPPCTGHTG